MKKTRLAGALLAGVLAFTGVPAIPGTSAPFAVTAEAASAKLAAPANVKATASGTTVKLTWSAVKGADAYRIYQLDAASGEYKTLKNVAKTSTSIKNLAKGTYKFRVAALVKSGSKLKAQTKSAVVSAKVTGAASSSSKGFVNFPAFGITGKKAAEKFGMNAYMKQSSEYNGFNVTVYLQPMVIDGMNAAAMIMSGTNDAYFAGLIMVEKSSLSIDKLVKDMESKNGKAEYQNGMYLWRTSDPDVYYAATEKSDGRLTYTMYAELNLKYSPDEFKKSGDGSISSILV